MYISRIFGMLPCPDSLIPTASVLPMIRRAALRPFIPLIPPGNGRMMGRGKTAFGEGFTHEIVPQLLIPRERSALLGM